MGAQYAEQARDLSWLNGDADPGWWSSQVTSRQPESWVSGHGRAAQAELMLAVVDAGAQAAPTTPC